MKKKLLKILAILHFLLLFGCASYNEETKVVHSQLSAGDYQSAKNSIAELTKDKVDSVDYLVFLLEEGSISRSADDINSSIAAFDKAYKIVELMENSPELSFGYETKAIFTNQSYLPYNPYFADKTMLCVYQALNYLEKNDKDRAFVELKRLENFQEDAARKFQDDIDKASQKFKEEEYNKAYLDSVNSNDSFKNSMSKIYGSDYYSKAKAQFQNKLGYFVSGVIFLHCAQNASDYSKAADFFRFAKSEGNLNILTDLQNKALQCLNGKKPENMCYVIFESGLSPKRDQIKIDIPFYFICNDIPYIGANFPLMVKVDSYSSNLNISSEKTLRNIYKIEDFDNMEKDEFYARLPYVIAKTLLSTAMKAAAQYGIQEGVKASNSTEALIAVQIIGSIYQAIMNEADLRTWSSLPKYAYITAFTTPKDGIINIGNSSISVDKNSSYIITVRQMSKNTPLSINKIKL